MKKIPLSLFIIFLLVGFEIPAIAQKKILVVSDQTTSNQFVFKEGRKIEFKVYGQDRFINATIVHLTDSMMTYRGNKFSEFFTIPVDSIKSIKKISGIHVFTRIVSGCVIVPLAFFPVYAAGMGDPGTAALALIPIAVFSIPWFIPARVLHIGKKYKIEILNE